jgi:hypothetical protein
VTRGALIRFLDHTEDGYAFLAGRAVTTCPECGLEIEASGYFMACRNALCKHLSLEHGINVPVLP